MARWTPAGFSANCAITDMMVVAVVKKATIAVGRLPASVAAKSIAAVDAARSRTPRAAMPNGQNAS